MEFEWGPQKAAKNSRKHKVSFTERATVFDEVSLCLILTIRWKKIALLSLGNPTEVAY